MDLGSMVCRRRPLVLVAGRRRSTVLTSDERDLQRLSDCISEPIVVKPIGPGVWPRSPVTLALRRPSSA